MSCYFHALSDNICVDTVHQQTFRATYLCKKSTLLKNGNSVGKFSVKIFLFFSFFLSTLISKGLTSKRKKEHY